MLNLGWTVVGGWSAGVRFRRESNTAEGVSLVQSRDVGVARTNEDKMDGSRGNLSREKATSKQGRTARIKLD